MGEMAVRRSYRVRDKGGLQKDIGLILRGRRSPPKSMWGRLADKRNITMKEILEDLREKKDL